MWLQNGNNFSQRSEGQDVRSLPVGIYHLEYGPFQSMYLERVQDKFEFPYKIYGYDGFPDRVIKKFQSVNTNMGVMLSGIKGTGKTVQARQICNLSQLPVIVVSQHFEQGKDLVSFLGDVNQDVVVMIDEYEKIFHKSEGLLTAMDGVLNSKYRRLFVLTGNNTYIADAMIDRPGRLHYIRQFGSLSTAVIREIVDDMLENKILFRTAVLDYLATAKILTIDIVKTVIAEVNLFNETPQNFADIINISSSNETRWDVFDILANKVVTIYTDCNQFNPFESDEGTWIAFGERSPNDDTWNHPIGYVKSVDKKSGRIVTDKGTYLVKESKLIDMYKTVTV